MAATSSRNDPFASFNFIVEIQGMKAGFAEVEGLVTETDITEYTEGNKDMVRKIAGIGKYTTP